MTIYMTSYTTRGVTMQFYNKQTIRKSRKVHQCHVCNMIIPAGSTYIKETGKYRGEFFSRCSCPSCFSHVSTYLSECGETEYDIDEVHYFVQEQFCTHCDLRETCMLSCLHCDTVIHAGEEMFSGQLGASHE